jgi:hypothetical protein
LLPHGNKQPLICLPPRDECGSGSEKKPAATCPGTAAAPGADTGRAPLPVPTPAARRPALTPPRRRDCRRHRAGADSGRAPPGTALSLTPARFRCRADAAQCRHRARRRTRPYAASVAVAVPMPTPHPSPIPAPHRPAARSAPVSAPATAPAPIPAARRSAPAARRPDRRRAHRPARLGDFTRSRQIQHEQRAVDITRHELLTIGGGNEMTTALGIGPAPPRIVQRRGNGHCNFVARRMLSSIASACHLFFPKIQPVRSGPPNLLR